MRIYIPKSLIVAWVGGAVTYVYVSTHGENGLWIREHWAEMPWQRRVDFVRYVLTQWPVGVYEDFIR